MDINRFVWQRESLGLDTSPTANGLALCWNVGFRLNMRKNSSYLIAYGIMCFLCLIQIIQDTEPGHILAIIGESIIIYCLVCI